jgi:L-amino acid N-acyltransferase YncA
MNIVEMSSQHWARVREIYLEGITTGQATFETSAPEWEHWDNTHHPFARLVALEDGVVEGWAAISRVSARQVYSGVAEVSVYVAESSRGRGFGKALLDALISEAERNGVWTLQAGIFPENVASLKLHLQNGFREVGRRHRIARLHGVWRDTVLLERRSTVTGID